MVIKSFLSHAKYARAIDFFMTNYVPGFYLKVMIFIKCFCVKSLNNNKNIITPNERTIRLTPRLIFWNISFTGIELIIFFTQEGCKFNTQKVTCGKYALVSALSIILWYISRPRYFVTYLFVIRPQQQMQPKRMLSM